jgi:hypothetical protein
MASTFYVSGSFMLDRTSSLSYTQRILSANSLLPTHLKRMFKQSYSGAGATRFENGDTSVEVSKEEVVSDCFCAVFCVSDSVSYNYLL